MSVSVAVPDEWISRQQYRAWYDAQIRMKLAIAIVLRQAIADARLTCQALGDGASIQTGDSDFEPDALVNCGPPTDDNAIVAPNPIVVVEAMSPGTRSVDTGLRLEGYFGVPSVMHHLIVNPLKRSIIRHCRQGDAVATRIVAGGDIVLHPPGLTISLEEVHREAGR